MPATRATPGLKSARAIQPFTKRGLSRSMKSTIVAWKTDVIKSCMGSSPGWFVRTEFYQLIFTR